MPSSIVIQVAGSGTAGALGSDATKALVTAPVNEAKRTATFRLLDPKDIGTGMAESGKAPVRLKTPEIASALELA